MTMLKPVGVLLAVGALAVLVQTKGREESSEMAGRTIMRDYSSCIDIMAARLQRVDVNQLTGMLLESRKHYNDYISEIFSGDTSQDYKNGMKSKSENTAYRVPCRDIIGVFGDLRQDPECLHHYGTDNNFLASVLIDLSNKGILMKERLEVFFACVNAFPKLMWTLASS